MEEIWKDIYGFEGYQISNYGRIKSFKNGKERIMKPRKDKNGYLFVDLHKNGKRKIMYIHRLVAFAYIPNDDLFKTEVNHIDENKENNNIDNLEWCTRKYNNNYGTRKEKVNKALSKQIIQYDLASNFIRSFQSTMEIQRQLGFNQSHICKCCKGKYKTAYGFLWEYA